ncbi:restriction endonuclease subunit S [Weissella kandleri]|uniref:restriction endonuclease subunit S n=1 Tax=Weissella kandleri TaxID=1616 RepID=UPI00387E2A4A
MNVRNSTDNKPGIRFAGYTDAWEKRKLGDISKRLDNLRKPVTFNKRISGDTPYYGANGIQDYVFGYTHNGEYILIAEDGASDINNYPVHYVEGKVWVNNHAHVLQAITNCSDNLFLMNNIKRINLEPYLVGGKRPKLNSGTLISLTICLPSYEEQTQIGDLFQKLDNLITVNQRKGEKLQELKKALLQKMFVSENNDIPEIRFSGYTDAWVQRKFGELIESYVEKTTINNQYPVLTSSQQGLMLQQEYFADNQVTSADNVGYFVLPKGYATYRSRSDNGVFKFNVNHIIDKGVISYFYPVFYSKTQNIDFLTITLNETQKHQVSILAEGTGQKVLSLNKLKSLKPSVPSIEEQDTIVAFLTILDNLITVNQRKVEKLQELKKALLQKMFV